MKASPANLKREKFFISIAPHFESHLLQEMQEVFPFFLNSSAQSIDREFPVCEAVSGGIEFEEELFVAVQFQFFLKTAHRILWRVDEFKAKDFPTLYNKSKSSRLKSLLNASPICNIKVAASQSRLGQEKRIAETVLDALEKQPKIKKAENNDFSNEALSEKSVYIRIFQDQVQFSIDLSGPHLHFRNYASYKLGAPLRETWAALFAKIMTGDKSLAKIQEITLIDPFAGSGTLLYEAALLMMPNFLRPTAINFYPQAPALFKIANFQRNYRSTFPILFKKLIAIDSDPKSIDCLKANFSDLKQRWPSFPNVHIELADCMSIEESHEAGPRWVFTNPPYGDRLQTELNLRSPKQVEALAKKLSKNFRAERVGLIVPIEGARPLQGKTCFYSEFSNGGIGCAFLVFDFSKFEVLDRT